MLERTLLAHPAVFDCFLSSRNLVYYVLKQPVSEARLAAWVSTQVQDLKLPLGWVRVKHLPIDAEGKVDEQALHRLPVLDDLSLEGCRQRIKELPNVRAAHVHRREDKSQLGRLHLGKLLPELRAKGEALALDRSDRAGDPVSPGTDLAFRDGGALVLPEQAPRTLTAALLQTARERPDQGLTFVYATGRTGFMSYGELLEQAQLLLSGLQAQGLAPGNHAILQIGDSRLHFIAFWACLLGGIIPVTVAVPPVYMEGHGIAEKLRHTAHLLDFPAVLCDSERAPELRAFGRSQLGSCAILAVEQLTAHQAPVLHHAAPDDVLFLQLSSGSTGIPKAIQITHRGVVAHIWGAALTQNYQPGDVSLNWLPFDHVVPTLTFHLKDCYFGNHQIHVAAELILGEPLQWLNLLEKYEVTHTWSPNFGFHLINRALAHHQTARHQLGRIRSWMNAGEAVTASVMTEFANRLARFGVMAHALKPAFGMAEACTCMTWASQFDPLKDVCRVAKSSLGATLMRAEEETASSFVSLGPPVPGVAIRIADEREQTLPEGVIGRFQIRGEVITPGYYRNDQANREAFIGEGWLNSGDLGFMLNGELYLTGRQKETIIVRGTNYFCYEIEEVVNGTPGVQPGFAAAVATRSVEGDTDGVAVFFVPQKDDDASLLKLTADLRARLASLLGIGPDLILPLTPARFPKTTSGKVQRVSLKLALEQGQFDESIRAMDLLLQNRNTLPDWFQRRTLKRAALRHKDLIPGATLCVCRADRWSLLASVLGPEAVWLEPAETFARSAARSFRASEHQLDQLFSALREDGTRVNKILFLLPLDQEAAAEQELANCAYGLSLIQALASFADEGETVRLLVATTGLFSQADACLNWQGSSLLGLIRVAPNEMPWLDCRLVDLPSPEADVHLLLDELDHFSSDCVVCWRDGQRLVSRLEACQPQPAATGPSLRAGGLYLITGGLGGVGQKLCAYLLEHYQAKLLICGRTPARDREDEMAELAELDGEALYVQLELGDEALAQVVAQAEQRFGRQLDGVFHLAGVFPFKTLREESVENLVHVFAPKVQGTLALHRLLETRPDALFLAFSSTAAHFGFMMSGAYAAANAFVDHFIAWRRQYHPASFALVWGIWDDLGMNSGNHTNRRLEARGLIPMPARQGILSLLACLRADESGLLIGLDRTKAELCLEATDAPQNAEAIEIWLETDEPAPELAFLDRFGATIPAQIQVCARLPHTHHGAIDLERLHDPEPEGSTTATTHLEETMQDIWCGLLGLERVGTQENFFELGGNSLLLNQMCFQLQKRFGRNIDALLLYRFPTIASLARHLRGDQQPPGSQARHGLTGTGNAVAIIGMAGRFPGAANLDIFWENLSQGRESVTFFSASELREEGVPEELLRDPNYVPAAPVLEDVAWFAASFFQISSREATLLDPQQRLFLESAWQALEQAGYNPFNYPGRIGVFAGATLNTYGLYLPPQPAVDMRFIADQVDTDREFIATRTAYKLNLRGPAVNVQSACSTSLVAVHLACQSLINGDADMALAGAASVRTPHRVGYYYEEGSIFSPDGHCRPFDAGAKGTLFGNGGGAVLLKPLARALADGDTIHAVILGSAINNDGSLKAGFTAPRVDGQVSVVRAALERAGVAAETVGFVEAHGTGTSLGDPIEISALNEAYGPGLGKGTRILGSVKGNIGHLDAASGMAGLLKLVGMLRHRQIAPNINFSAPNPLIDFASFRVCTQAQPWQAEGPRRAGISSLGVGGTNAHLILEEPPLASPTPEQAGPVLLRWSAQSEAALDTLGGNLARHLEAHPETNLRDVARTLNEGRPNFTYRRHAVVADHAQAVAALRAGDSAPLQAPASHNATVWMFPGQGAQYPGMGTALHGRYRRFTEVVDHLLAQVGPDLRRFWWQGEGETLAQTQHAQPALFILEYALACQLMEWGVQPAAMIGHSLGEYVAATLAGVFTAESGLALVSTRARLMSQVQPGAMLAVSATRETLSALLDPHHDLAAVNGVARCVVSTSFEALDALIQALEHKEIAYRRLHTSHAYHSAMMEPILEDFRKAVLAASPRPPQLPFISNVSGSWITPAQAVDPNYWSRHLRHTVNFAAGLEHLRQGDRKLLIEIGPGRSLCTPARDLFPGETPLIDLLPDARHVQETERHFLDKLGLASSHGIELAWGDLYGDARRIPLPGHPLPRQRFWIDTKTAPGRGHQGDGTLNRQTADQWCYQRSWQRGARLPVRAAQTKPQGTWLVFAGHDPDSAQLCQQLERLGASLIQVRAGRTFNLESDHSYRLDPEQAGHFESLLRQLIERGLQPDRLVFSWSLEPLEPGQRLQQGFFALLRLAHALEACSWQTPLRLVWVCRGQLQVTGSESGEIADAAALGAMAVLPREFRFLNCAVFDLEHVGQPGWVEALIETMAGSFCEGVTALRGTYHWRACHQPIRLSRQGQGLRQRGHYLLHGADSGTAMALADYLMERWQARVTLVVPGDFPDLQAESLTGSSQSRYSQKLLGQFRRLLGSADVSLLRADAATLSRAVNAAEASHGPLQGAFHLAGVQDFFRVAPLRRVLERECRELFTAKLEGLNALAAALPQGLDFVLLWSSLDPILGEKGSGPMAAANACLDAFARKQGKPWLAVAWDRWHVESASLEMDSTGALLFKEEIGPLSKLGLSVAEGIGLLEQLLTTDREELLVSTADLDQRERLVTRYARHVAERRTEKPAAHPTFVARPALDIQFEPACNQREAAVADLFAKTLGLAQVGRQDHFFELGGDSLLFLRMGTELKRQWQLDCPLPLLFETPTPMEIAHHLSPRIEPLAVQAPAAPVAEPEIRRHQFEFTAQADIDEKKQLMRETYNAVSRQLNTTEFGDLAIYLTFGYRETDAPTYSPIALPDPMLNRNCIKLVLELIGDLPLSEDDRVLDVGCGRGGTLAAIHRFYPTRSLTGLDLSPEAVAFNQRTHTWDGVNFVEGDAENLPFQDASFTLVTNVESSHSYPNLQAFYREVYRVLEPGGHFVYTDLFPTLLYDDCKDDLRRLGFEVLRDRDITRNVLKSCDEIGHTHLETFRDANDLEAMGNFLGVPGSKVYNDMQEGHSLYTILKLRKPRR